VRAYGSVGRRERQDGEEKKKREEGTGEEGETYGRG
jgi:hypothetical protein